MADRNDLDGGDDFDLKPFHSPVFNGLGRKATFMGVPTMVFLGTLACVAVSAMFIGLYMWVALFILIPLFAAITRSDDRAFEIWKLELKTRVRNLNKSFWNGSSYTPMSYPSRRPWRKK